MGGNAFASRRLYTPRMPSKVYHKVKQRVHGQLCTLYDRVETPIEGPGKKDHGDIDVLVLRREGVSIPTMDDVMAVLGAIEGFTSGPTMHLAVKWPDDEDSDDQDEFKGVEGHEHEEKAKLHENRPSERSQETKKEDNDDEHEQASTTIVKTSPSLTTPSSSQERYIQVDVHVCPTPSILQYRLFTNAHSDLGCILGVIIRPFGLITSTPGLCVMIPELEHHDRSLSRVTVTDQPDQILRYLGLHPIERYWTPFSDWDSAMDYATTCRFWGPRRERGEDEKEEEAEQDKTQSATTTNEDNSNDSSTIQPVPPKDQRIQTKAHDRGKSKVRPMLKYWFDTYLHSTSSSSSSSKQQTQPLNSSPYASPHAKPAYKFTHDEVVTDLQTFFGPTFTTKYETQKSRGLKQVQKAALWSKVRKGLPCTGGDLGRVMKGVKFEVAGEKEREEDEGEEEERRDGDNGGDGDVDGESSPRTLYRRGDYDGVAKWALGNWEGVLERQRRREGKGNDGQNARK